MCACSSGPVVPIVIDGTDSAYVEEVDDTAVILELMVLFAIILFYARFM